MDRSLIKLGIDSASGMTTIRVMRPILEGEYNEVRSAISYCRTYSDRLSFRLVAGGKKNFDHAVDRLNDNLIEPEVRQASEEISVALVSFVLLWRLSIDQALTELSARFGKTSSQYTDFVQKTKDLYGSHPGYRLVEGLRNYVAHHGMPPISGQVTMERAPETESGITSTFVLGLSKSKLLASDNIPRILKRDLEESESDDLPLVELMEDAASAFATLVDQMIEFDRPELDAKLEILYSIFNETVPEVPAIADMSTSRKVKKLLRFDDLFPLMGIPQEPPRRQRLTGQTPANAPRLSIEHEGA
jgi:hypothetical protein